MITFSYRNGDILKMLKDRAEAILENDYLIKEKHEKKIMKHLKKNEEEICTPVRAFITFANEESYL